ncbi:MAG: membrane dipeptidase, partial [Anaerolinea sp.]|nr:membrane dipeptidase [Anaerolinea sp.]
MIVDAHLDLAYNAVRGRNIRLPASQQPFLENEYASVGLPDLRRGGVGLICATIFCSPASYRPHGYHTPDEARALALQQLAIYQQLIKEGELRFVRDGSEIQSLRDGTASPPGNRAIPAV